MSQSLTVLSPEPDAINLPAAGKVEGVDILVVAIKGVPDTSALNIPDANSPILGASCQQLSIRREANGSNVKIPLFVCHSIVLKLTHLLAISSIKYLGLPVAAGSNISAVVREANAAHHGLMDKVVKELNIKHARNGRIEDGVPVLALTLEMIGKLVWIQVRKHVPDIKGLRWIRHVMSGRQSQVSVGRRRTWDLRRGPRVILIWHWLGLAGVLLRSRRAGSSSIPNVPILAQTR